MNDAGSETIARRPVSFGLTRWRNRLVASRGFQRWAARFPLTRGIARRDGEAIFDLVAGFVHSQVLFALVQTRLLHHLRDGKLSPRQMSGLIDMPADRAEVLAQAATALGLMTRTRKGFYGLSQKGAALIGVPGLEAMIRHHDVLYRDLADPVALLRGETEPELAGFWPYVFGEGARMDPEIAARYSDLMADSQGLVAEDTLRTVSLKGVSCLMDVGGGSGAFLSAALAAHPRLRGMLFDLPQVAPSAAARFDRAGLSGRIAISSGSFREQDLPGGADAISLVRVLYDHSDDTVRLLLARAFAALPVGGKLIVSEPMSGGAQPERAGDAYFALYTLAMGTGRTRSAAQIAQLLQEAGFDEVTAHRATRPFVTSVVSARRGLSKKTV